MGGTWFAALTSALVVSLISFVGAFLLSLNQNRLNKILLFLVCFAVGALLGNVFFHLLPESYLHIDINYAAWLCIAGFLAFFIIGQLLQIRKNDESKKVKNFGYLSLYADALHNFTDGILIAVAWMVSPHTGIATTLVIILHEIPQEIGDFGVLLKAGFSRKKALLFNFYSGCTAILGTVLTLWLGESFNHFSTYILPFAAGGFIYLATTSLLPEVLKNCNRKNYWFLLLCIVLGVFVMYYFNASGGHAHSHSH